MLSLLDKSESLVDLSLGEWFVVRRKRLSLSQEAIGKAVGVTTQSVSNWEKGRSVPTLTPCQMIALCKILECELKDLCQELPQ